MVIRVKRRWKRERVIEIYGDTLGDCICNLPISHNGIKDTRTWIQNPHGIYTTKSAYSWMILKKVGFGPYRFFWRSIWKLKMLPKIKIFSWRIGHNILPTFDNIARIRHGFNNTCPRCQSREETLIHAMKDCSKAREVLVAGGLNNRLLDGDYIDCIDWLEDVFREFDNKAVADFLTLLWNSWNDRNNMVFNGKMDAAVMIWERARILSKDFRIFNFTEPPVFSPIQMNECWEKPPNSYIKVNVDTAVSKGCSGFGAIARTTMVFKEGIKLAKKLKLTQLNLESDSAVLVNKVNKRRQDITILGQRIKQECEAFKKNTVADYLCNLAITNKCDVYFDMDYPLDIHNIILKDAIK
ncbi:hypothetical protein V6Z11_A05G360000 [Gossypium hirsutum]